MCSTRVCPLPEQQLFEAHNGIATRSFSRPGSHLLGEGGKSKNRCVWDGVGMMEEEAGSERRARLSLGYQ